MCLHDMLYGSLGVIKFDIKLVVMYFFENLLFLLILNCIALFGVAVIATLIYDMLSLAYFKEVVLF